jgi:dolichyl-phosphate beta-glucosyltransferase
MMVSVEQMAHLTVVIPAYNEEKRLGPTLERILGYLEQRSFSWEIVVVNDGSKDQTTRIARELLSGCERHTVIDRKYNRGKGYSVRQGMMAGHGRFLLFSDADLSTPIEELERLLPPLEAGQAQVSIGSRGLDDSRVEVHQPWWREAMGKSFNLFVRLIALGGLRDTQCGFKCFTREAARSVFSVARIDGFGFDVEALYLARKFGYDITEVPVRWVNSPDSKVHPVADSSKMLADLLRIRFTDLRGGYRNDNGLDYRGRQNP